MLNKMHITKQTTDSKLKYWFILPGSKMFNSINPPQINDDPSSTTKHTINSTCLIIDIRYFVFKFELLCLFDIFTFLTVAKAYTQV